MEKIFKDIIQKALKEDIGEGDITTEIFVKKDIIFHGTIISKSNGILCGTEFASECFKTLNPDAKIKDIKNDGQTIKPNDLIMEIVSDRTILSAERTALNIIQRLSGIATKTKKFVDGIKDYSRTKIYDTRKTTPNLRAMEKYAVKTGGGENHRFGLFDAFMIKDNHIAACNNFDEISNMIKIARKKYSDKKIEIEVKSIDEVKKAILLDVDIIMLDNMSIDDMKIAIEIIRGKRKDIEIEISGGINETNIKHVALLEPDRISIGALTHSYTSLDISLEIN
jgi:nicotinate-nucleotide pyrophosphorylase (carboxylating)